jgi:hypothetical protein
MKKHHLILLLIAGCYFTSSAQTNITIIGTSHEKTHHNNADSILTVLKKIKPDLILLELDTALMDEKGNFKGRAINNTGNEFAASRIYKELNNNVILRRFDIEGRSAYYDQHKTFAMENKLGHAIDSLFNSHLLDETSMQIISRYYKMNQSLNELYDSDLKTLNSKEYTKLAGARQYGLYQELLAVIDRTPQLKTYYDFQKEDGDFWTVRNKAMADNITQYVKQFKGKNIVVLTGAMHKYKLIGYLEDLQASFNFKLNDLPQ